MLTRTLHSLVCDQWPLIAIQRLFILELNKNNRYEIMFITWLIYDYQILLTLACDFACQLINYLLERVHVNSLLEKNILVSRSFEIAHTSPCRH